MTVRDLARLMTPPVVWAGLSRFKRALSRAIEPPVSRYCGLEELDRKIEHYVDFDDGFFIEIGGWDGVTFSNSLYFERHRGWRGILIEPSPSEFSKCRANRPDAYVFCYACVPFEYTDTFVPMLFCASMTVTNLKGERGIHFDPRAHVEDGRKFLRRDQSVFEFGAVAKPLSGVLDEAGLERTVDLLILDVEGYELAVLGGLDFTRHAPRFICVEAWALENINAYLAERDYEFLAQLTKHDYLYRRRGAA